MATRRSLTLLLFGILCVQVTIAAYVSGHVGARKFHGGHGGQTVRRRAAAGRECMDKYQRLGTHSACQGPATNSTPMAVNATEKELILKTHNQYRSNVQPSATNMLKMSWDEEIAMIAQAWSETCSLEHDEPENRDIPGRLSLGQNIGDGFWSWTAVIDAWYAEVKDFTFNSESNEFEAVGHYTQGVWADSNKLGCGAAQCGSIIFYVCNYGPAGNVDPYYVPYEVGTPCAACPQHCEDHMCACGDLVCENGGEMNRATCKCDCQHPWLQNQRCQLNCSAVKEPYYCGMAPYRREDCDEYENVPHDCPTTCEICPYSDFIHGAFTTTTSTSTTSTTTTTTATTTTTSTVATTRTTTAMKTSTLEAAQETTTKSTLESTSIPTATTTSVLTLSTQKAFQPTKAPSEQQTTTPALHLTTASAVPQTAAPSVLPTTGPSVQPTTAPNLQATTSPIPQPTTAPNVPLTTAPSVQATTVQNVQPTTAPREQPTTAPNLQPTTAPSVTPTTASSATTASSVQPTTAPSVQLTTAPNEQHTTAPNVQVTTAPNEQPTTAPNKQPTTFPNEQPTATLTKPLSESTNFSPTLSTSPTSVVQTVHTTSKEETGRTTIATTSASVRACADKFAAVENHSACKQRSPNFVRGGVSEDDKDLIVREYNRYRSSVNPPASNMMRLRWDTELAVVAQGWAETCNVHGDDPVLRTVPGKWESWDRTWLSTSVPGMTSSCPGGRRDDLGNVTGSYQHYAQLVWASTVRVGCAFADCGAHTVYVCNYAPSMNMLEMNSTYTQGTPCEQCPDTCMDKLCDCGEQRCENLGRLDPATCTCQCQQPFHLQPNCSLSCAEVEEASFCKRSSPVTCSTVHNMAVFCPWLCNACPYGEQDYRDGDSKLPTTHTNSNNNNNDMKNSDSGNSDKTSSTSGSHCVLRSYTSLLLLSLYCVLLGQFCTPD